MIKYGRLAVMKYCFKIVKSTALAMGVKLIRPNFCTISGAGMFPLFHISKGADPQFSWCSINVDNSLQFASMATPAAEHLNKWAILNTVVFVQDWIN